MKAKVTTLTKNLSPFRQQKDKVSVWFGLGIILGLGSSAIALGLIWQRLQASLPASTAEILTYTRPNTLTIEAADGTFLQQIGSVTHTKVEIEQLPEFVYQAFIASEDRRFYQHKGVDFIGISRAAFANFKAGGVKEGGSTITQQLARIVFLTQERNLGRKLKEMEIARQIEQEYSKEQILESYLNLVYLGSGAYGLGDAAWNYFGKTADKLTVAEVATLAAIVPAPSVYSPFENPDLIKKRRDAVLISMQREGFITASQFTEAIASPLSVKYHQPKRLDRQAHYFTDYIRQELPKYISPEELEMGGIVVETTLKPQWQKAAEETVKYGIEKYGKGSNFQEAALVAIDPHTGEIGAMVGGKDFSNNEFNRVTQAQRQPGSTFKTFVYTAAIAAGFSPYKSYLDTEYYVDGYKPKNYKDYYRNTEVSLYNALISSINIVALRTMLDVGWKPIIEVARKMGIKSELQPTYSLALGSWEVNLLELTNAYGTLANEGIYQPAYGITRIRDRYNRVIYEADFSPQPAIDKDTAAMMSWMLQGVVTSGTGIPAQIGRPAAGKTGTSDEYRDLWYVGYIPQTVAGIWLGNDDNQPTQGISGTAAELWRKFMLNLVEDMAIASFPSRPATTGREVTVEAEPVKPKRSYYLRQPTPVRRTRTRSYSSPTPKASPPPKSAPIPTAKPSPPSPAFSKPKKDKLIRSTDPERDWVRERLGR